MTLSPLFRFQQDALAIISALGGLTAWQVQLDWTLRIIAALVAITAGGISIYRAWRKLRGEAKKS